MTSVVRYISGTSPLTGSTSGNDYQLVNVKVAIGATLTNTAVPIFTYTGSGTIKNIVLVQFISNNGVLRNTANADTIVLDAIGKIITYTPQTAALPAGYINLILEIGNY